ncbi:MAG: response regulator [Cryomorphaceae bacterium]|nr:response regulator [Cryomorphaceae bacterium]
MQSVHEQNKLIQSLNFSNLAYVLIDDNKNCGFHLKDTLKKIGVDSGNIKLFVNADKGLKYIENNRPSIVFLDIEMPQQNGISLCNILKEKGFSGKVIFTTAYSEYILDALRARAYDYLIKPVLEEDLIQTLNRVCADVGLSGSKKQILKNYGLSERQIEIADCVFAGKTSKEIADELFLSKHTVDTHRRNILKLTGVKNTFELYNLISNEE